MSTVFSQAAYFIQCIGGIVSSLITGNAIRDLLFTVMTLFCTLKIIGKLSYRESGG